MKKNPKILRNILESKNKNFGKYRLLRRWLFMNGIFKRTLPEISAEIIKLTRGLFLRLKFDKCGRFLRAGKHIIILKKNASIIVGTKVQIYKEVRISAWGNEHHSEVIIGDNTSIGDRTEIHAGRRVEIGCKCNIAWDVCIMDRDYHKINSETENISPVKIGDNVWIGCNSIILRGVIIGEGAVIAAGSVVTKNVQPKTLVGGNPAMVLRKNVNWFT